MQLKKDYVLRQVADMWVVVPTGKEAETFRGFMKLNETGAILWQGIGQGLDKNELAKKLVDTFGIEALQARADVEAFFSKLAEAGCLEA